MPPPGGMQRSPNRFNPVGVTRYRAYQPISFGLVIATEITVPYERVRPATMWTTSGRPGFFVTVTLRDPTRMTTLEPFSTESSVAAVNLRPPPDLTHWLRNVGRPTLIERSRAAVVVRVVACRLGRAEVLAVGHGVRVGVARVEGGIPALIVRRRVDYVRGHE